MTDDSYTLSDLATADGVYQDVRLRDSMRFLDATLLGQHRDYLAIYVAQGPPSLQVIGRFCPKTPIYVVEPTDFVETTVESVRINNRWLLACYFPRGKALPVSMEIRVPSVMLWHPVLFKCASDHG